MEPIHCVAATIHQLAGKYITLQEMNKHVLKLRKTKQFAIGQGLYSQACQDVCRRVDNAYQCFFTGLAKRPKFCKAKKYRSFTFPQSGYQIEGHTLTIGGVKYKFVKHREIGGVVKTATIKRDAAGQLWVVLSVVEKLTIPETSTGQIGGFDFGLKDFLIEDQGERFASPQFYRQGLQEPKRLSKGLSCEVEGSKRYKHARRVLAKHQIRIADKRRDHHFKLANQVCDSRAVLCFEDLNLKGMKALWGRKVNDLDFGDFMSIVQWVAFKRGKQVRQIGRWERTTGKCSQCGHAQQLALKERLFRCEQCALEIGPDHNASQNIKTIRASMSYPSEDKPKVRLRSRVNGRSSPPGFRRGEYVTLSS